MLQKITVHPESGHRPPLTPIVAALRGKTKTLFEKRQLAVMISREKMKEFSQDGL